jgi:hypothetical protein
MNDENDHHRPPLSPFNPSHHEHLRPLTTHLSPLRNSNLQHHNKPRNSPFRSKPLKPKLKSKYIHHQEEEKTEEEKELKEEMEKEKEEETKNEGTKLKTKEDTLEKELLPPRILNMERGHDTDDKYQENNNDDKDKSDQEGLRIVFDPYNEMKDNNDNLTNSNHIHNDNKINCSNQIVAYDDERDLPSVDAESQEQKEKQKEDAKSQFQERCQSCASTAVVHVKSCVQKTYIQCQNITCKCSRRVPYICLVCCPSSVLFWCIKQDVPDFPKADAWLEEDNKRKVHCTKLLRYYTTCKRVAYVWIRQTCCSQQVDEHLRSRAEIAFEERRLSRLECKKQKRLTRIGSMMNNIPLEENFRPARYRAPPRRSTRTMLSAYQLACMAREQGRGQKKEVALKEDRFSMVKSALNDACYTVDGKVFFQSKRRLVSVHVLVYFPSVLVSKRD